MSTTAKALVQAVQLADKLAKWFPASSATLPVITPSNDSAGNPVITLSADATPAAGERVVVIRIKGIPVINTDSLGNAAILYSSHTVQICTERNFEGTTDNVQDILRSGELLNIFCECAKLGHQVEWFNSANGTVPDPSQMTDANRVSYWVQDLYSGSQARG